MGVKQMKATRRREGATTLSCQTCGGYLNQETCEMDHLGSVLKNSLVLISAGPRGHGAGAAAGSASAARDPQQQQQFVSEEEIELLQKIKRGRELRKSINQKFSLIMDLVAFWAKNTVKIYEREVNQLDTGLFETLQNICRAIFDVGMKLDFNIERQAGNGTNRYDLVVNVSRRPQNNEPRGLDEGRVSFMVEVKLDTEKNIQKYIQSSMPSRLTAFWANYETAHKGNCFVIGMIKDPQRHTATLRRVKFHKFFHIPGTYEEAADLNTRGNEMAANDYNEKDLLIDITQLLFGDTDDAESVMELKFNGRKDRAKSLEATRDALQNAINGVRTTHTDVNHYNHVTTTINEVFGRLGVKEAVGRNSQIGDGGGRGGERRRRHDEISSSEGGDSSQSDVFDHRHGQGGSLSQYEPQSEEMDDDWRNIDWDTWGWGLRQEGEDENDPRDGFDTFIPVLPAETVDASNNVINLRPPIDSVAVDWPVYLGTLENGLIFKDGEMPRDDQGNWHNTWMAWVYEWNSWGREMVDIMRIQLIEEDDRGNFDTIEYLSDMNMEPERVTVDADGSRRNKKQKRVTKRKRWAITLLPRGPCREWSGEGLTQSKYPTVPLEKIMWAAAVNPEGNKWQILIENFRCAVDPANVVTDSNGISTFSFLQEPMGWRGDDYACPAYLLGRELVTNKKHTRGRGWRFLGHQNPWGSPRAVMGSRRSSSRSRNNNNNNDGDEEMEEIPERDEETENGLEILVPQTPESQMGVHQEPNSNQGDSQGIPPSDGED